MNKQLDQYRKQIDAVDEQIIALIKERVGIVAQVGALKREHAAHLFPIRPAREANMIRRIAKEFTGSGFSPAAAVQIWRTIIGASTAAEAQLTIATTDSLTGITREYFSAAAKITTEHTADAAIVNVIERRSAIAVVSKAGEWWRLLANTHNAPKIFACIPFADTPKAFAIGYVQTEESGDDISVYAQNGTLIESNGFETLADAKFLGAYARPFQIEQ